MGSGGMAADLLRRASDRTAPVYDERFGGWQREKYALALHRHPLPPPGDGPVLDAGCGTGLICEAAPGRSWVGADLSAAMLVRAFRRGMAVVQADLDALPFRSGAFAAAVAFTSFVARSSWDPALSELARVVRPGGLLLVTLLPADLPLLPSPPPDGPGLRLVDRFACGQDVGFAWRRGLPAGQPSPRTGGGSQAPSGPAADRGVQP